MKEAKAMLESVAKTYAESLNADERNIYDALKEKEQEAFRICRDLALLQKPESEPLHVFSVVQPAWRPAGNFPDAGATHHAAIGKLRPD